MPSAPRPLIDGGCYHVIARGNNRQRVFQDKLAFEYFLKSLQAMKDRYPVRLYHYCLMPNHIHFLLQIANGPHLPKLMHGLLRGFARWFQHRTSYVGHVWQARFKSPMVNDESYFLEVGRYIERNPIRAGLVDDLREYPWSSYSYYAYGMRDDLVDEDPYYAQIGSNGQGRQRAYRDFVKISGPYEGLLDEVLLKRRTYPTPERRHQPAGKVEAHEP